MSENNQLTFESVFSLYESCESVNAKVNLNSNELEFAFADVEQRKGIENKFKDAGLGAQSYLPKSFSIDNRAANFIFFDNLKSLFDKLKIDRTILQHSNIFVFDEGGSFLFFDYSNQQVESNLPSIYSKDIIKHFIQYTKLLNIFLANKGKLVEIEKQTFSGRELIILSKGEDKMVTSISYTEVNSDIFQYSFYESSIDSFETKLMIDEWLACFKNTVCQYMELQSDARRTFVNLYNNFEYIFNQTQKNYELYVSKFSFDKIRKQFRSEKNSYFENLNLAQDKISSQIISIPISLGASVYSFFQLEASLLTLVLIFTSICIYSLFIIYVIVMNLYDVKKLATDVKEEKDNMSRHYTDLLKDYESDFKFMNNKRQRVVVLAWAIMGALVLTLILITVFIINYQDIEKNFSHFA